MTNESEQSVAVIKKKRKPSSKLVDYSGKKFGKWTVIGLSLPREKFRIRSWNCVCDCGTLRSVRAVNLFCGTSQSCGCVTARHGKHKSGTYSSWQGMISRCKRKSHPAYKIYGGRGIKICERWSDFVNFLEDMGDRPDGYSLDRIDTNGNYEKSNCRWASPKTQMRNRRNTLFIEFNGEKKPVTEWSEITKITPTTLMSRASRGWSAEKTLTHPVMRTKPSGNYTYAMKKAFAREKAGQDFSR